MPIQNQISKECVITGHNTTDKTTIIGITIFLEKHQHDLHVDW